MITWIDASRTLGALDRAWPEHVYVLPEDTLHERLQWHKTEHEQLHRVLQLADELNAEERRLAELALPAPEWDDLHAVRAYAGVVDTAAAEDAWSAATEPLRTLEDVIDVAARWSDAAPPVEQLRTAVGAREHLAYATAHHRLARLWRVRRLVERRNDLGARLAGGASALFDAVMTDPAKTPSHSNLATFEDAWSWASTGTWLREQETVDVNELQTAVTHAENSIRKQVEVLAARRAWDHAASPARLGGKARADLTQYVQLVQRMGKGTGKYAAQRKAEVRRAMDRCRPSVPVWIMPLYRIADQLRIEPDMFDVVIVDEASQAGMEATFLQYLAKKIVVIGDDKQVSPSAVGIDQQQLRDLAGQYLAHDRYRASWQDPKRSLFDEAKMRYGGLITLTEHRRCVPEIIGFSNRIAYEPDGVRLVPVRQYGADRLDPIKAVHLPDGYQRGTTSTVNPVEVDAIVDQIEKCIADPAYDGKSFGVISLLGPAQAKQIQTALLDRLPREEWGARDLRCGDAADFQGAERDVMFLSMVAAPEPGRRMGVLTQDANVQRFNVAVSRAKDQVWVFHSVDRHELTNQNDMRFQLLDYCYGVIDRGKSTTGEASSELAPEDVRDSRFGSLFEQRVHNRIVDRGYTVIPQYEAQGFRIDLVVVGGQQRLAVECDGDHWHGPEAFQHDLARQRELERCGWRFFRIRESSFYTEPAEAMSGLWETLRELDIHPAGELSEPVPRTEEIGAVATAEQAQLTTVAVEEQDRALASGQSPKPVLINPSAEVETVAPDGTAHTADERFSRALTLDPYPEFSGTLPAVGSDRSQVISGLREIVAVEGPILGSRLHGVYVRSSGGKRVGREVAKTLNSAISTAVRRSVLVADDPLAEPGVKPKTYRLPDQSPVHVRELGPRLLEAVPPAEIAATMAVAAREHGWDDEQAIFRATLDALGLQRLTKGVQALLSRIAPLAREEH